MPVPARRSTRPESPTNAGASVCSAVKCTVAVLRSRAFDGFPFCRRCKSTTCFNMLTLRQNHTCFILLQCGHGIHHGMCGCALFCAFRRSAWVAGGREPSQPGQLIFPNLSCEHCDCKGGGGGRAWPCAFHPAECPLPV